MFIERIKAWLDVAGAALGILVGGIVLWLFPSQRDLGAVIIVACILYLLFRNKLGIPKTFSLKLSDRQNHSLNIAFWFLFTASIWLYQTQSPYHRPVAYFILLSLLAGIIAVEILSLEEGGGNRQVYWILLQILLLSASLRIGIFYEFPSFSGADSFFHIKQTQYIVDTGYIPPYEYADKYAAYPAFYAVVAMTQVLTSLSLKNALFWSTGLYTIISAAFIYFIGQKVAGPRIGLLATLLISVNTFSIDEGVLNIIPATLVTSWFLLMLYLVICTNMGRTSIAMLLFVTIILIITHQISTFIVLFTMTVLLLAAIIGRVLYNTPQRINLNFNYLLLFTIMLITYWMGNFNIQPIRYNFFGRVVGNFLSIFKTAELGYAAGVDRSVWYGLWSNTLFDLGYLILLVPAIGGILRWINTRDTIKFSIAVVAISLLAVIYGASAFGVRLIAPTRWFQILSAFLVITASWYMVELAQFVRPRLARIGIFSFISLLTFFMISTPNINKDNPFYAMERAGRTQLKASEVAGISTLNEIYSGIIKTDSYYTAGIIRQLKLNSRNKGFDTEYVSGGIEKDSGALVIVRETIFEEPVTIGVPEVHTWAESAKVGIIDRRFLERFNTAGYNTIYTNGEVTGYLSK